MHSINLFMWKEPNHNCRIRQAKMQAEERDIDSVDWSKTYYCTTRARSEREAQNLRLPVIPIFQPCSKLFQPQLIILGFVPSIPTFRLFIPNLAIINLCFDLSSAKIPSIHFLPTLTPGLETGERGTYGNTFERVFFIGEPDAHDSIFFPIKENDFCHFAEFFAFIAYVLFQFDEGRRVFFEFLEREHVS